MMSKAVMDNLDKLLDDDIFKLPYPLPATVDCPISDLQTSNLLPAVSVPTSVLVSPVSSADTKNQFAQGCYIPVLEPLSFPESLKLCDQLCTSLDSLCRWASLREKYEQIWMTEWGQTASKSVKAAGNKQVDQPNKSIRKQDSFQGKTVQNVRHNDLPASLALKVPESNKVQIQDMKMSKSGLVSEAKKVVPKQNNFKATQGKKAHQVPQTKNNSSDIVLEIQEKKIKNDNVAPKLVAKQSNLKSALANELQSVSHKEHYSDLELKVQEKINEKMSRPAVSEVVAKQGNMKAALSKEIQSVSHKDHTPNFVLKVQEKMNVKMSRPAVSEVVAEQGNMKAALTNEEQSVSHNDHTQDHVLKVQEINNVQLNRPVVSGVVANQVAKEVQTQPQKDQSKQGNLKQTLAKEVHRVPQKDHSSECVAKESNLKASVAKKMQSVTHKDYTAALNILDGSKKNNVSISNVVNIGRPSVSEVAAYQDAKEVQRLSQMNRSSELMLEVQEKKNFPISNVKASLPSVQRVPQTDLSSDLVLEVHDKKNVPISSAKINEAQKAVTKQDSLNTTMRREAQKAQDKQRNSTLSVTKENNKVPASTMVESRQETHKYAVSQKQIRKEKHLSMKDETPSGQVKCRLQVPATYQEHNYRAAKQQEMSEQHWQTSSNRLVIKQRSVHKNDQVQFSKEEENTQMRRKRRWMSAAESSMNELNAEPPRKVVHTNPNSYLGSSQNVTDLRSVINERRNRQQAQYNCRQVPMFENEERVKSMNRKRRWLPTPTEDRPRVMEPPRKKIQLTRIVWNS